MYGKIFSDMYEGSMAGAGPLASKCHERGTLMRSNGTPHTASSIARLSRCPEQIIKRSMDIVCSPDVEWLEVSEYQPLAGGCGESAGKVRGIDEEGNGMEGNGKKGTEGNGKAQTLEERYQSLFGIPGFREEWGYFLEARKTLKAVSTDRAHVLLLNEIMKRPDEAIDGIQLAIRKSWKGFDWDWYDNTKNQKGLSNGRQTATDRRAEKAEREFPEDIKPKML